MRYTGMRGSCDHGNGMIGVCIVHFNTPDLTSACVKSVVKSTPSVSRITVFDNSDHLPFVIPEGLGNLVRVLDNTGGNLVDLDRMVSERKGKRPERGTANYGSARHCRSVQWLIDNSDDPFVLLDSDVLCKSDMSVMVSESHAWVGECSSEYSEDYGLKPTRILPFACYINVPMVKNAGARYFNEDFMWRFSEDEYGSNCDTGAWFYRDCEERGLDGKRLESLDQYIVHYGSASYRKRMSFHAWIEMNRRLWE